MDWADSNRRNKDGIIVGGWWINRLLFANNFSTAHCVQVFNMHLIGFQLRATMWEWKRALKKRGIMSLQKTKAVHHASEPDEISVIIGSRASFRFTAVRVMKYTSQHCCGKTVGSKVDLFRECRSSIWTESWWIKLLSQVLVMKYTSLKWAAIQCSRWRGSSTLGGIHEWLQKEQGD